MVFFGKLKMLSTESATSKMKQNDYIADLTDLQSIMKSYEQLCDKEVAVSEDIKGILSHQKELEYKMETLQVILPNLQLVENDSQQLANMVSFTSTLAENVSGKVRKLDLTKGRVIASMQRVDDVLDLKFCTDGVQTALHDEDYEQAAAHVHRFLSLDENVLRMSADASEGSTLDTSFKLLHESQVKLKKIVHSKFDSAVHSGDVASVERFFKIFPLIGEHDEGLKKFSKYLCAQLSATCEKNLRLALQTSPQDKRANVLFADTMTLMFEGIARVIEIHQPLVETYYGPGRLKVLLEFLQVECDRQSRAIISKFKEMRQFDAKAQLVQQSLMNYKSVQIEKLDPKDLDVLLAEITLLNTRAELYLRFVRRRISADTEVGVGDGEDCSELLKQVDQFITDSDLSKTMQEVIGTYIMMEEYFMREMVIKAVNMDMSDLDDGSLTSSMVDDTFFIIKKCVRRAMSSSSVDGICAMLNHATTVLEQDYREVLYTKLRYGFPSGFDLTQAYNFVQSSLQGKANTDDDTQKSKAAFLTTLNNAEVSCEYIQTLKQNLEEEVYKLYGQANTQAKAKLETCLSDLGAVSTRFKDVLNFGFTQLSSSALKPRVKPWVDVFLSTSHNISEDEYFNYEVNDPWVQNFIVQLDTLLSTFKPSLTATNYDTLVSLITSDVVVQLEKATLKTTFNRLGGVQFDRELRSLVGYLTSVTTWTLRDKFARLTQMSTILNLEQVNEILDYWGANSGPLTWRLTPAEVRQVLTIRIDFKVEEIKRLKL